MWHRELNVGYGYACTLIGADLGNRNSSIVQVIAYIYISMNFLMIFVLTRYILAL